MGWLALAMYFLRENKCFKGSALGKERELFNKVVKSYFQEGKQSSKCFSSTPSLGHDPLLLASALECGLCFASMN